MLLAFVAAVGVGVVVVVAVAVASVHYEWRVHNKCFSFDTLQHGN